LQVTNLSQTKIMGWLSHGEAVNWNQDKWDLALRDEFGNNYLPMMGTPSNHQIRPLDSAYDHYQFELPVKLARRLTLTIPAEPMGQAGAFVFNYRYPCSTQAPKE